MTDASALPSYADLPVRPGAPGGSSWGVWGERDVLGCLNLLTPERARRGAQCVRTGATYRLDLPLHEPAPALFGRPALQHEVIQRPSGVSLDDHVHMWNTQSSTQWDGFRHIRSPRWGSYSGIASEEHGVHHWASHGMVGRGVLADVARWRASVGRPIEPNSSEEITADDLRSTLAAQRVAVEPGDILLVRTGWVSWFRSLPEAERARYAGDDHGASPGLANAESTPEFLWNLHIAAVGMDNPAIEPTPMKALVLPMEERLQRLSSEDPGVIADVFLHITFLVLLGIPLGELFDLDVLAADCAAARTWDFLFTSAPIGLYQGAATPPNFVAVR